jgi:hypothetical protein
MVDFDDLDKYPMGRFPSPSIRKEIDEFLIRQPPTDLQKIFLSMEEISIGKKTWYRPPQQGYTPIFELGFHVTVEIEGGELGVIWMKLLVEPSTDLIDLRELEKTVIESQTEKLDNEIKGKLAAAWMKGPYLEILKITGRRGKWAEFHERRYPDGAYSWISLEKPADKNINMAVINSSNEDIVSARLKEKIIGPFQNGEGIRSGTSILKTKVEGRISNEVTDFKRFLKWFFNPDVVA